MPAFITNLCRIPHNKLCGFSIEKLCGMPERYVYGAPHNFDIVYDLAVVNHKACIHNKLMYNST